MTLRLDGHGLSEALRFMGPSTLWVKFSEHVAKFACVCFIVWPVVGVNAHLVISVVHHLVAFVELVSNANLLVHTRVHERRFVEEDAGSQEDH